MTTELAHVHDSEAAKPDVIRPVATAAALLETFQAYQKLERALLIDDDYQMIERKRRKKKSAWRKLATAMGVSLQLKEKAWERDEAGRIVSAEATAVATAPNGRLCDGWGGAHVTERCCPRNCRRGQKNRYHSHCPAATTGVHTDPWAHWTQPYHDLRALAETRAKNRAASDLFGFGEVSAEEIGAEGTVVTEAGDVVDRESGEVVQATGGPAFGAGRRPADGAVVDASEAELLASDADDEVTDRPMRQGADVDAWRKRASRLVKAAKQRLEAYANAEIQGGYDELWQRGTPGDWSAAFAALDVAVPAEDGPPADAGAATPSPKAAR